LNIKSCYRIITRSFSDFFRDEGIMLAGSLSYFFMMALIPFGLIIAASFGYFIGEREAFLKFFSSRLTGFFPEITRDITVDLKKLITYKGLGKFSLILYGLLSYEFFRSLETALNSIFKIKSRRPFILSLILSLVVSTLILFFFIVSFGASSAISMLKQFQSSFPDLQIGTITGFLLKYLVPLALMFMTVTSMYIILPRKRVRINDAASGAAFTALFLEAAKHLFTFYVVKVAKLGTVYGPLSAFVIFLLWVFYSSCIFLIGAEVVHTLAGSQR
jgi:membrane protein